MAPLTDLVIFIFIGLIIFLISRRWSKIANFQVINGLFGFILLVSIMLAYPKIHPLAIVVLSAGLAVTFGRIVSRYQTQMVSLVNKTYPALLLIFLLDLILMIIFVS
jgi:hypothetical protein